MSYLVVPILIAGALASSLLAALSGFVVKDYDESKMETMFVVGPIVLSILLNLGLILLAILAERSGIL